MYNFNPKQAKDQVVQWICDWFEVNGEGRNAVIGVSGGKDSSVVAALCAEALGKARIDHKHETNLFKLKPIPHFEYEAK